MGADVDVVAIEREIREEIARKEREGLYPPELLDEVLPDSVRDCLDAARATSQLSLDPPTGSMRRALGPLVSLVKQALASALRWHTRWLLGQVETLGSSLVAAVAAVGERLDEVERRQRVATARLGRLEAGLGLPGAGPRQMTLLQEVCALRPRGRVACLGAGARLLADLAAWGADCYGVEADGEAATAARDLGLDVRVEDVLAHLTTAPAGRLGAIVAVAPSDLGGDGWEELLRSAAAALGPNGCLVVETAEAEGPGTAGARLGIPLADLAESAGFSQVTVRRWPDQDDRLRALPVPGDAALDELVQALNGNLLRINRVLFGPGLLRVVARRR